jgi:hypothetical protein
MAKRRELETTIAFRERRSPPGRPSLLARADAGRLHPRPVIPGCWRTCWRVRQNLLAGCLAGHGEGHLALVIYLRVERLAIQNRPASINASH